MICSSLRSSLESTLSTEIQGIVPYKGNYKVEVENATYISKKVDSPKKMNWLSNVTKELQQRGVQGVLPVSSYMDGWALYPFIEGRTCSYKKESDINKVIKLLSRFHGLGRQLNTMPPYEVAYLLYDRLYERLKDFYQILQLSSAMDNDIGLILNSVGRYLYFDGLYALKKLYSYPVQQLIANERKSRCITHRDLASHNWLIDKTGNAWLIDLDTADYDCQVGDLWQIISRIMWENKWDVNLLSKIIKTYEKERPLSVLEYEVLLTLLSFPNEFFRESIGIVRGKKGYEYQSVLTYLSKISDNIHNWRKTITDISSWL